MNTIGNKLWTKTHKDAAPQALPQDPQSSSDGSFTEDKRRSISIIAPKSMPTIVALSTGATEYVSTIGEDQSPLYRSKNFFAAGPSDLPSGLAVLATISTLICLKCAGGDAQWIMSSASNTLFAAQHQIDM